MSGRARYRLRGWQRVAACLLATYLLAVAACGSAPTVGVGASPTFSGVIPSLTTTVTPKKTAKPKDPILAGLTPAQQVTVKLLLAHMTLDEKLGQMFLIETTEKSYNQDVDNMVRGMHAGAMIVYQQNIGNSNQLKQYLADIQAHASPKLMVSMDEEGGVVDRLGFLHLAPPLPSASYLGSTGSSQKAYDAGKRAAKEMLALGINTDLAPVVDVRTDPDTIEYTRIFGDDPRTVDKYAGAFMKGLHDGGVVSCLKHWPGIGSITKDPHDELPTIDRSLDQLESVDFAAFKGLLSAKPGMIMVTHVIVSALDPTMPATLSPIVVQQTLRDKLGYQGVVMTDSLYMKAISKHFTLPHAAVLSVVAGDDLLEGAFDTYSMRNMLDALKAAIANGQISKARISQSAERILALKVRFGIIPAFTVIPSKMKVAQTAYVTRDGVQPRRGGVLAWREGPRQPPWGGLARCHAPRTVTTTSPGVGPPFLARASEKLPPSDGEWSRGHLRRRFRQLPQLGSQARGEFFRSLRRRRDRVALGGAVLHLHACPIVEGRAALEDLAEPRAVQPEGILHLIDPFVLKRLDLGVLAGVRVRNRQRLAPIHAQALQRLGVDLLVHLVPHDQIGDRRAQRLVRAHLVDAALLQAPRGLQHQVVEQVEDQIAAVVDVGARPGVADGVHRQRALRSDEEVVDIPGVQNRVERSRAAGSWHAPIAAYVAGLVARGAIEQAGYGGAD
jgi:beta-N-acetylhexosaminidase